MGSQGGLCSVDEEWSEEKTPSFWSSSSLLENGGVVGDTAWSDAVCSGEPTVLKSRDCGMEKTMISFCCRNFCGGVGAISTDGQSHRGGGILDLCLDSLSF